MLYKWETKINTESAWQRVLQLASSVIVLCVDLPFYLIKCVEVVSVLHENVIWLMCLDMDIFRDKRTRNVDNWRQGAEGVIWTWKRRSKVGMETLREGAALWLLLRDSFMAMRWSAIGRDTGYSRGTSLVGKLEGREELGVPVGRWEYNIKVALWEVECELQGFNSLRIWASVAEKCFIQCCC